MNTLKPRILLVEDTPDISLWLGTALRQGGMAVSFATDGLQADQCLQPGHGFDAVLLDLQLPGRDGLSVLQALRERGDAVPVLILTARASVPDRVLGLNMGADDYLPKPFDLSELEARLQVLLRRHGRVKPAVLRCGPLEMQVDSGAVQLHGQPPAVAHKLPPQPPPFIVSVVGGIGAKHQQQAHHVLHAHLERQEVMLDGC